MSTIIAGDEQIVIENLPEGIQKLIKIYEKWSAELVDQKLSIAKTEAALRDLSREIQEAIKEFKEPAPYEE